MRSTGTEPRLEKWSGFNACASWIYALPSWMPMTITEKIIQYAQKRQADDVEFRMLDTNIQGRTWAMRASSHLSRSTSWLDRRPDVPRMASTPRQIVVCTVELNSRTELPKSNVLSRESFLA